PNLSPSRIDILVRKSEPFPNGLFAETANLKLTTLSHFTLFFADLHFPNPNSLSLSLTKPRLPYLSLSVENGGRN
ncbi:unnamed protein product, partial [Prunus brigantina]